MLSNFDDCGFGKYSYSLRCLARLMPLRQVSNLLVRGSNPCWGTRLIDDCKLTIDDWIAD